MIDLEPPDVATLASMLAAANAEHRAILPRGGGTKVRCGPGAGRVDAVLSTTKLIAPIDHAAGDLIATLPAGASLDAVNAALAREGQRLPLDPPFSGRATIGGIVATNDSGPRRHRYGTPRDLIIGIEMALTDGRTAKAGGHVVKNVAGYDLGRLLCGSYGTLAVITSATFKLSPMPPASRTVVAELADLRRLGELTQTLNAAPLTPSTIELDWEKGPSPALRLLIRFESTEHAADRQAAAASAICESHGATVATLADAGETDAWRRSETALWNAEGTIVKIAVLPTDVAMTLSQVERLCAHYSVEYRTGGRAALGILFVRLAGNAETHGAVITELRHDAGSRRGSVLIVSSDVASARRIDPWGDIGDALPLMRAVKARFDPHDILSPGRGPGGI